AQALDLLGFESQLIFNSSHMKELHDAEHGDDVDYAYGIARAHNRALVDFCSVDRRLLPVGYVPLADFDRASQMAGEALEMGCKALLIASACPKGHSPSHVALDPVWARAQEAGIPIVLGASWVPGWMRNMDSAADAFRKNEERLQKLELKPSEYVRRQIRVTPYPHEDAGWCIANSGEEVCLFSTDYPHVEGGRNPLG